MLFRSSLACSGSTGTGGDDTAGSGEFCSTLADGNTYQTLNSGGNGTSGDLVVRVITSESTDPYDPLFVAFKDYSLESEGGGVPTTGRTSGDGLVDVLLGAGNWTFTAAYARGSTTCLATLAFPVDPNTTTYACPVMDCP